MARRGSGPSSGSFGVQREREVKEGRNEKGALASSSADARRRTLAALGTKVRDELEMLLQQGLVAIATRLLLQR